MSKLEGVRRLKKPDGTIIYVLNGKLHNWEEPAVIHPDLSRDSFKTRELSKSFLLIKSNTFFNCTTEFV